MTISFSKQYLKGLHRGSGPSPPVMMSAQRLSLGSLTSVNASPSGVIFIGRSMVRSKPDFASLRQAHHDVSGRGTCSVHTACEDLRWQRRAMCGALQRLPARLGRSPRTMLSSTVSAMSSALWPVAIFAAAFRAPPRSRACGVRRQARSLKPAAGFIDDSVLFDAVWWDGAEEQDGAVKARYSNQTLGGEGHTCRRKTPQKVQLFFVPISRTISSIVHPYSSLYDTTVSGIWYCDAAHRLRQSQFAAQPDDFGSVAMGAKASPLFIGVWALLEDS